jgi:hypothetical protein
MYTKVNTKYSVPPPPRSNTHTTLAVTRMAVTIKGAHPRNQNPPVPVRHSSVGHGGPVLNPLYGGGIVYLVRMS